MHASLDAQPYWLTINWDEEKSSWGYHYVATNSADENSFSKIKRWYDRDFLFEFVIDFSRCLVLVYPFFWIYLINLKRNVSWNCSLNMLSQRNVEASSAWSCRFRFNLQNGIVEIYRTTMCFVYSHPSHILPEKSFSTTGGSIAMMYPFLDQILQLIGWSSSHRALEFLVLYWCEHRTMWLCSFRSSFSATWDITFVRSVLRI